MEYLEHWKCFLVFNVTIDCLYTDGDTNIMACPKLLSDTLTIALCDSFLYRDLERCCG